MAMWDDLSKALMRLNEEQPGVLQAYPDPRHHEGRTPPFDIRLAPWAAAAAEDLHHQFGDSVTLTVGALPFPPGTRPTRPVVTPSPAEPLNPREATAELDGPAIVRSGETLHHGLLLHNLAAATLQIATNGQVTADIIDPETGKVVGGFAGAQTLPLVTFRIQPGETGHIPLVIGTASFMPELGYAVPAGSWGLQATLTLGPHPQDSSCRRTPVLPLTITS